MVPFEEEDEEEVEVAELEEETGGLDEGWKAHRQILVLESAGSLLNEWHRRKWTGS